MLAAASNPYHCSGPIRDPQAFYGRSRQLQNVFDLIAKGGCVNVVGERRSGKTSLLFQILHPHVQRHYASGDQEALYVYLDAEICPEEPKGFLRELLTKVRAQLPHLPVSPEGDQMEEDRLRGLLEALGPRRLVVLIDEFENVAQQPSFPARFFVFLRGLCNCYNLSLVVASCKRLTECCPHEVNTSPFPNIFTPVFLGSFTPEELESFIRHSSAPSGAPIAEVRDVIVSLAGYYPYLLQMACRHCFDLWIEKGRLSSDMAPLIRRRFEEEARPYFESVWKRYLSKEERETCLQMARGEEPTKPNVVWRLEQKGYAYNGRIASEVFADLIRQDWTQSDGFFLKLAPPRSGIWVDEKSGNVYVNGKLLTPPLTDHQFRLLRLLYQNKGSICDLDTIIKEVFGQDYIEKVDDQRIAQLVSRLRKRIEPEGRPWQYIQTIHGRGLRLGDGSPADNSHIVSE